MVYIPFWFCAIVGAVIDLRERRFPNVLAGVCAVAAFAGVWLDRGMDTALHRVSLAAPSPSPRDWHGGCQGALRALHA